MSVEENLKAVALDCRKTVLKMIYWAQSCHIGSCLSSIEIATAINHLANVDSELRPDRDRIVYSKGWIAAVAYYFLVKNGIMDERELADFYLPGSDVIGLVERKVRGIDFIGSAMGMGVVGGTGYAFAAKKIKKNSSKAYVIMSDGELSIGTNWECAAIASHHGLDNLVVVCDYNKWQAMGRPEDVLKVEPIRKRWESFGWETREVDGHDLKQLVEAMTKPHEGKPLFILAHTVKGKGISEFEDKMEWHYRNVEEKNYVKALEELTYA